MVSTIVKQSAMLFLRFIPSQRGAEGALSHTFSSWSESSCSYYGFRLVGLHASLWKSAFNGNRPQILVQRVGETRTEGVHFSFSHTRSYSKNKATTMAPRQPKREDFIDWQTSEAKEIILEALKMGAPTRWEWAVDQEAWNHYRFMPALVGPPTVVFDQFKARLKDHRKQYKKFTAQMEEEELGFAYDREFCFPRQSHNQHGEPVFDMSPAKSLLQEDVRKNLHKMMSPALLQKSRPEYMPFSSRKFKEWIYQEEKTQKWYWHLEIKHVKKEEKWWQEWERQWAKAQRQQSTQRKHHHDI